MKFDFSNTKYVRMFEDSLEGRRIISYILNDPNLVKANYTFWRTFFPADPTPIPTDKSGRAAVRVEARQPEHATMADWRAPLGNSRLAEGGAASEYNAGIIDLIAPGWQEQAMEREYKEKLFQDLGDDAPLLLGYATDVLQPRVDSVNMALSNMAAQALSKSQVVYKGGKGITGPVYKAPTPAENFTKMFHNIISDPDCDILAELAEINQYYTESVWGNENMPTEYLVPEAIFLNNFLKNAKVIDWLKVQWLLDKGQLINQTSSVPSNIVDEATFQKYAIKYPGLPPIRVIREKQLNDGVVTSGWSPNIITLKATGFAGKTYRTEILDRTLSEKYGNNIITKVFGTTLDGIVTVENTTGVDGQYKYWATDVKCSATPILDLYLYMAHIDTSQVKA